MRPRRRLLLADGGRRGERHRLLGGVEVADQLARIRDARVGGDARLELRHPVEARERLAGSGRARARRRRSRRRRRRWSARCAGRAGRARARRGNGGGRARAGRARRSRSGRAARAERLVAGCPPPCRSRSRRPSRARAAGRRGRACRAPSTLRGSARSSPCSPAISACGVAGREALLRAPRRPPSAGAGRGRTGLVAEDAAESEDGGGKRRHRPCDERAVVSRVLRERRALRVVVAAERQRDVREDVQVRARRSRRRRHRAAGCDRSGAADDALVDVDDVVLEPPSVRVAGEVAADHAEPVDLVARRRRDRRG